MDASDPLNTFGRFQQLEVDHGDEPENKSQYRAPITVAEREALRQYLDALDAVENGALHAQSVMFLPATWARLRELLVETRAPLKRQTVDKIFYRTEDRVVLCRTHLLELSIYKFHGKAVKVQALGVREVVEAYEPPECGLCKTTIVFGHVCENAACVTPLHPQWPAVYCSNTCAMRDA